MKRNKIIICLILIILTLSGCAKLDIDETTTSTTVTTTAGTTAEEVRNTTQKSVTYSSTTAEITSGTVVVTTLPVSEKVTETKTTQSQHITSAVQQKTTAKQTTTKQTTTKKIVTTKPSTTKSVTTTLPTKKADVCYVTIVCSTINDNITSLKDSKKAFVPLDGIILNEAIVEVSQGDSAFDIIKKACKENTCKAKCKYCQKGGIQIEYTYTPAFDNYYIEGIHQIYEKDCGTSSGWMYSVNGVFPNVGVSAFEIKPGDKIVFAYTCNMGEDIGNSY